MTVKIPRQIEAEYDSYLEDCFHDANFITSLIDNNLCFISGRKGTGKTALCRHLKKKFHEYNLDYADLISLDEIGYEIWKSSENKPELLLLYIATRTIQLLLKEDSFETGYCDFWKAFLEKNGLQNIEDYKSFVEVSNEHKTSMQIPILKRVLPLSGENTKQFEKSDIANSVSYLYPSLRNSLPEKFRTIMLFDNISDYLDVADEKTLREEINVIKEVFLYIERFNASLVDEGKTFRFVFTIRDDLWDYMDGANVNKLDSNTLKLTWNEESFCRMLIRRLPYYEAEITNYLAQPTQSIKKLFPDRLFSEKLLEANTNRYSTNFYAYMMSVSFNRPRDFLQFCLCMKDRLSLKKAVKSENIKAAEIEYSDYFFKEIKDELNLITQFFGFQNSTESIADLMYVLSKKESFNSSELRAVLKNYLESKKASNSDVYNFINQLWWYGILGFREEKVDGIFIFKYMNESKKFPVSDKLKDYIFVLHKGIWWSMRKRFGA